MRGVPRFPGSNLRSPEWPPSLRDWHFLASTLSLSESGLTESLRGWECRSRAVRRVTLERRRDRYGPARVRPSLWAGPGRARWAEARVVRRDGSGASGAALALVERDQPDVAEARRTLERKLFPDPGHQFRLRRPRPGSVWGRVEVKRRDSPQRSKRQSIDYVPPFKRSQQCR